MTEGVAAGGEEETGRQRQRFRMKRKRKRKKHILKATERMSSSLLDRRGSRKQKKEVTKLGAEKCRKFAHFSGGK